MPLCFVLIFQMKLFVKKWIFKILQVKKSYLLSKTTFKIGASLTVNSILCMLCIFQLAGNSAIIWVKQTCLLIFFWCEFCYYFVFLFHFKILLNFCKRSQANAFILSLSCIDLLAGFTGKVGAYRQQPGNKKFKGNFN